MHLSRDREAWVEVTEDFIREAMNPDIWAKLWREVFVFYAYPDLKRRAFYYHCWSSHFDKNEGRQIQAVWTPELIKVPGLHGVQQYAVHWRRKADPFSAPIEREQSPTWKETGFKDAKERTI